MRFLTVLTLAALAAAAGPAAADSGKGAYLAFGLGRALTEDARIQGERDGTGAIARPLDAMAHVDDGWTFTGALGWALADGLRAEGEIGYRTNDIGSMHVLEPGSLVALLPPGAPPAAAALLKNRRQIIDGNITSLTLMANLYYDMEMGGAVTPYIGGGIGLARLAVEARSADGRLLVDDDDMVPAWKLGGGLGYRLAEAGGWPVTISLDYRYYATGDPTFTGSLTGTDFDTEQSGHLIGIGLRFGL